MVHPKITEFAKQYPAEVVVFLGAGASVYFDMPLMDQFFSRYFTKPQEKTPNKPELELPIKGDKLLKLCMRKLVGGSLEKADLEEVLEFLVEVKDSLKAPSDEKLLTALELAITARYGPGIIPESGDLELYTPNLWGGFVQQIDISIRELTRKLYEVYAPEINFELNKKIRETYTPLFNIIAELTRGNIMVFTTNYDPCVDVFFQREKRPAERLSIYDRFVVNGFETYQDSGRRLWNVENYFLTSGSDIIAYFNLHGSVLWKKEAGAWVYSDPDKIPQIRDDEEVALEAPVVGKGTVGICSEMKAIYTEVLKNSPVRYFFTIGYSYRDPDIFDQTKRFLTNNQEVKFIYLSPKPDLNKFEPQNVKKSIIVPDKFGGSVGCKKLREILKKQTILKR